MLEQLSSVFNNQLQTTSSWDSEYWVSVNLSLMKGYELPAYQQNMLDDINQTLTNQFRNQEVDVSVITQEDFESLVQSVDLSNLGQFIGYKGIDHHYHVTTGLGDRLFKLEVDLKCIPTSIDKFNGVVSSICFISGKLIVGDKIYQDVCIKYIGPQALEQFHSSVVEHGKTATNEQLGRWLHLVRNIKHKNDFKLIT